MRTDDGLEGWMLVNFIALSWYYKIYAQLLEKQLLSKFSADDVLQRASKSKNCTLTTNGTLLKLQQKLKNFSPLSAVLLPKPLQS